MNYTPEQPPTPEGSGFPPELLARLEDELSTYKSEKLLGTRDEYEELIRNQFSTRGEMDTMLSTEEKELSAMDSMQGVSRMLNNFHLWLPGGLKREVVGRKEKREEETQSITKSKKLITDVDACIRDAGYGELTADELASWEGRQKHLPELATLYLAMRDKGYERTELTS